MGDQQGLFDEPLSGPDLDIAVHQSAFSPAEADRHLQTLLREIDWQQEEIRMFGKKMPIPRLTAWYGDKGLSYTYSGIEMQPTGWADCLAPLRERVGLRCRFNSVLLNLYRSGEDGVSWHADDEPDLHRSNDRIDQSWAARKFASPIMTRPSAESSCSIAVTSSYERPDPAFLASPDPQDKQACRTTNQLDLSGNHLRLAFVQPRRQSKVGAGFFSTDLSGLRMGITELRLGAGRSCRLLRHLLSSFESRRSQSDPWRKAIPSNLRKTPRSVINHFRIPSSFAGRDSCS